MLYEAKRLFKITGKGINFIVLLILRSPVDLCFTVIQALFMQKAFNAVENNDIKYLIAVCFIFIIANFCIFFYNGIIWSIYSPFTVKMEARLRIKLFDKIASLAYERMEATLHSDWLTRLNTDVQMPFSQPLHLPHAANAVLRLSISAILLWAIYPSIFGWVFIFAIPHFFINQFFVTRIMQPASRKSLEATANNSVEMNALIACADISLLYDGQDYLLKKFERSSKDLLRAKMRICKIQSRGAAIAILPFGLSGYLILLIMSSEWITQGNITFGDLTAAFQYRLGAIIGINMLINCIANIKVSMAGIQRINETMNEEIEDYDE